MNAVTWPLGIVSLGMIVGAIIDGWKFKVPNKLTFPLILSGWLLGAVYTFTGAPEVLYVPTPDDSNRLLASLMLTGVAFLLLGPVYLINYMGAGDVKLLMGLGAWIGAIYGRTQGTWFFFYAYCCGVLLGGVLAILMMLPRWSTHVQNVREILKDWATGSLQVVADKAAERKKMQLLLPYGVPLTIGMVTYFWLREYALLPEFLNPFR